jgi:hypothetical protein
VPLPGWVRLTFEREPGYFAGCALAGPFCQTLCFRHHSGTLAAVACRSVRPLLVNGRPQPVGLLSHLRVDPRFVGRFLVQRGFSWLRELHQDGRTAGYLATITRDNPLARAILVRRPRGHMPEFRSLARLHCLALYCRRSRPRPLQGLEILPGSRVDLGEVARFLRRQGGRRQFFPLYSPEDLAGGPQTPGFQAEDLLVALRRGRVVGTLGLWDQSGLRQTVVQGYALPPWLRALLSWTGRLGGAPPLPEPGQPLRQAYASFLCLEDDCPVLLGALLQRLLARAAGRGLHYLLLGLCEGDPLLPAARRQPHAAYESHLYAVSWKEDRFCERLDGRLPFVELACL